MESNSENEQREVKKMKKKILALLLASAMVISTVACASAESQDKNTETTTKESETKETDKKITWSSDFSKDEFGDVAYDSEIFLRGVISGDFSNTATSSSELGGFVFIQPDPKNQQSEVAFRLLEYGKTPATYLSSEEIILKTKVGNEKKEYTLFGSAPNGDVAFNPMEDAGAADNFYATLYSGQDIKCIITIGSSQYNFTVESNNLVEAVEEANNKLIEQAESNEIHSATEVLIAFFNKEKYGERYQYLVDNMEEFPLQTTEEINKVIENYWLAMKVEPIDYEDWRVWEYKDNVKSHVGYFSHGEYKLAEGTREDYVIEEDELRIINPEKNEVEKAYQVRKLQDGYYFLIQTKGISKVTNEPVMYIYVQYDENGQPKYNLQ